MKGEIRQAPSEIADRNFEKSIDSLASVGMLANEAERFRRGRTGTEEVAERRSQARNGSARVCAMYSACDERAVAQWNGRGREGDGADRKPVERSNRALVTAQLMNRVLNCFEC